jgi:hypothetical protein
LASLLETQVYELPASDLIDYARRNRADNHSRTSPTILKSEMWSNYLSQRLPASQWISNFGDSLNCVSGRIIGLFHQTVKIWSTHLDIRPGAHPIFVSVRIIGYNPGSFTIPRGCKSAPKLVCRLCE